jgi:hypothetical protein
MVRAIKEDFSKIFGDYRVYLCMFGLMIVCLLSYFEMIRGQNFYNDVENGFTNLLGNEIILFCFLICIVGGSFLYCIEERHGYLTYVIKSVGVKNYVIGKLLVATVSGFVIAFVGLILTMMAMSLFLMTVYQGSMISVITVAAFERIVWQIVLFAMLCGLLSAMGFLVTTFYANYYIGLTTPILIYYAILSIYNFVPIPVSLQISKVYLMVAFVESGFVYYFIYALLYTLCYLVIFYRIAVKQVQRRIEHA